MIAYSNGDLLNVIREAVLEHAEIEKTFSDLCRGIQCLATDATEWQQLLEFIWTKSTRMRGQAFAWSMKGQVGKTLDVVEESATQIQVAAKACSSRAAANAIKNLYGQVESTIFQMPDDDEIENDIRSNEQNETEDSDSNLE
jgi:hypothetical protein